MSAELLNPTKALIFRIMHRNNAFSMLKNGLYCRSARAASEPYVQIGNADLIDRRQRRQVDHPPGGTLSDYVPFYFTPYSPMMYNIKTGFQGVQKRPSEEIVFFISSLHKLVRDDIPFVYSDRHAYLKLARFTNDLGNLDWIDWTALQARNFRKDDSDRFERYQAEALVYNHLPATALLGIACYSDAVAAQMKAQTADLGLATAAVARPEWYL